MLVLKYVDKQWELMTFTKDWRLKKYHIITEPFLSLVFDKNKTYFMEAL